MAQVLFLEITIVFQHIEVLYISDFIDQNTRKVLFKSQELIKLANFKISPRTVLVSEETPHWRLVKWVPMPSFTPRFQRCTNQGFCTRSAKGKAVTDANKVFM